MNTQTDQQRRIEYLERRVDALYYESARLSNELTGEYSKQVNEIARNLEVYVDKLKVVGDK